jgi:uncharacterized protein YndB with AHSA1/START domain
MEVQAYIDVNEKRLGQFQFGLVRGSLDGEIVDYDGEERLEFTWEGQDELEPVFGSSWLKLRDDDNLEGWIKFHLGDRSTFRARRVG